MNLLTDFLISFYDYTVDIIPSPLCPPYLPSYPPYLLCPFEYVKEEGEGVQVYDTASKGSKHVCWSMSPLYEEVGL